MLLPLFSDVAHFGFGWHSNVSFLGFHDFRMTSFYNMSSIDQNIFDAINFNHLVGSRRLLGLGAIFKLRLRQILAIHKPRLGAIRPFNGRAIFAMAFAIHIPKLAASRPFNGRTIFTMVLAIVIPKLVAIRIFNGRGVFAMQLACAVAPRNHFEVADRYSVSFHDVIMS
jgi:hypothetical protein